MVESRSLNGPLGGTSTPCLCKSTVRILLCRADNEILSLENVLKGHITDWHPLHGYPAPVGLS